MPGVRHIPPVSIQHAGESSPGPVDGQHHIATQNRWSSVSFTFKNVNPDVWSEFSFQILCDPSDKALGLHDFAVVGVAFLMDDGSIIDFAYVPGLSRAQIDPFNDLIAGPAHQGKIANPWQPYKVRCNFLVPSPATAVSITIRSWRNSHPFKVIDPVLRQFEQHTSAESPSANGLSVPPEFEWGTSFHPRHNWKALRTEPNWDRYAVLPGHRLFIRGQVVTMAAEPDGVLARIVFRDAQGEELTPPYPETAMLPAIGAFIRIPVHKQARRFTLELLAPSTAATVEIGFQALRENSGLELVTPLEVSLDDNLLLETISGDDLPDAAVFIKRLTDQLGLLSGSSQKASQEILLALLDRKAIASRLRVFEQFKAVQQGISARYSSNKLHLANLQDWPLPEKPDWNEDPFRSPAWRQEYQSLSWLLDIARSGETDGYRRALALALSWSRANPSGLPSDTLSAHPISMAVRAATLLELLAAGVAAVHDADPDALLELLGEVVRHGFTLSEVLSQNVFSHSIYQIYVASSLLVISKALPRIPLASYWAFLALARIKNGFNELMRSDGAVFEQSQHYRLELISFGLILSDVLMDMPEASLFRDEVAPRLKEACLRSILLTDPAGMLPPFGDTPHASRHATWLKKLIVQHGKHLAEDPDVIRELSYPTGSKSLTYPDDGLVVARHYENGRQWGYFCSTLSEQPRPHGHNDSTSFVFASGGVRWIGDPAGSSEHQAGPMRHYLRASRAHNIALPDGREQTAGIAWLQSIVPLDGSTIYTIGTTVHGLDYRHQRFFIVRNDLSALAVFDRFTSGTQPVSFEGFLHFEPEIMAAMASPRVILAIRRQKRMRIVPQSISGRLCGLELVQAINESTQSLQGYVFRNAGGVEPACVLRYRFAGFKSVCGGVLMALNERSFDALSTTIELPVVKAILASDPSEAP